MCSNNFAGFKFAEPQPPSHSHSQSQMHAGIMPARLPDMLMLPVCHASASASADAVAAGTGAADLLNQCTTEWSRYFIAATIAPRAARYTAALTADLSPQLPDSPYCSPDSYCRTQPQATFGLRGDSSASSSSSSSPLSTSPAESPASDAGTADGPEPDSLGRHLRKVASCAVTARERSSGKRRVQFADEVGLALTRVRFLSEPCSLLVSDHPASEAAAVPSADPECSFQLKCKFTQPCSKYIVFRESVERNHVSLSLVHLDFGTIRGIIAVKNVSFRKRVFARVTFDDWRSFRDVAATFNGSEGPQDNFAFSVQCPADQVADVQFCVCFESDSGTYWDSNGGLNYRVAACRAGDANASAYTKDFKPNYAGVGEFSQFSAWEHFADRVYY